MCRSISCWAKFHRSRKGAIGRLVCHERGGAMMRRSVAQAGAGVVVLAVLLGHGGQASADTAIDTTGSWDRSNHIGSFGEPNLATFGQTFTVGNDNVLKSFSFWLRDIGDPDQPDFIAYIARWGGNSIIGPILFQSPSFTVTSTTFTEFAFDTGGLILQPGAQYLAFLERFDPFRWSLRIPREGCH